MKVKVSERALVARIRRKLEKDGRVLKAGRRDSRWYAELGGWYIVDTAKNAVTSKHCDLEKLGRELGALKDFEEIEGQDARSFDAVGA